MDAADAHLVGGFKHFLFSISYMGCHPKPIDFHSLHHFSELNGGNHIIHQPDILPLVLEEMQMDLQPFQLERALLTLTPSIGQLSPEAPVLGVAIGCDGHQLKLANLKDGYRFSSLVYFSNFSICTSVC